MADWLGDLSGPGERLSSPVSGCRVAPAAFASGPRSGPSAGAGVTLLLLKPDELRPGLWRWTAAHPEWQSTSADGTPTDWARDVACVLYATERHAVFFDPLVGDDEPGFWSWADEHAHGREVVVLETIDFHRRSRTAFLARYGAGVVPPASVESVAVPAAEETVFWIPEHRALVPGDVLIGTGAGELALCPQAWLEDLSATPTLGHVRQALGVLRDLDVELVLVSHGDPVLDDGRAALARVLDAQ